MENKVNLQSEVDALRRYQAILDQATSVVDSIKDSIRKKMTDAGVEVVIGDNYKVTYKAYSVTRIDSKALRDALPEIADKFSITSEQKRLLVK